MRDGVKGFFMHVLIETAAVYVLGSAILIVLSNLKIIDFSNFLSAKSKPINSTDHNEQAVKAFGTLTESVIVLGLEGEIVRLDNRDGIKPTKNSSYAAEIDVQGKEATHPTTVLLTKEMLDIIRVSKKVDGQDVPIAFKELSLGDNISIRRIWNFNSQLKKYIMIEGNIQKL